MSARAIFLSPAVTGVVGALIGAAAVYKYAERKFADLADLEIEQAKAYYKNLEAKSEERLEQKVKERADVIIDTMGYGSDITGHESPSQMVLPMDDERFLDNTWDFALEVAKRTDDRPFIIHYDEFMLNETEYDQVEMIFYAGDGVLSSERDDVVDLALTIGAVENLRFGYGSNDDSVVYIRNHNLSMDISILWNSGSYSEIAQGLGR